MQKSIDPPSMILESSEDESSFSQKKQKSFSIKQQVPYGPDFSKRALRSNSHMCFAYRPEFVPRPRPKNYEISPSPMILSKKRLNFDFSKNETFYFDSLSDNNISENETEEFSYKKDDYGRLSETRKEMFKFKNTYQRTSTASSRDTESLTLVYYEVTSLHKKFQFYDESKKKKNSKSIFSKVIKKFMNDDIEYSTIKNGRNTVNTSKQFSILNILEESANTENQLMFLRCKSTLI